VRSAWGLESIGKEVVINLREETGRDGGARPRRVRPSEQGDAQPFGTQVGQRFVILITPWMKDITTLHIRPGEGHQEKGILDPDTLNVCYHTGTIKEKR
jgi:hypothetical protein